MNDEWPELIFLFFFCNAVINTMQMTLNVLFWKWFLYFENWFAAWCNDDERHAMVNFASLLLFFVWSINANARSCMQWFMNAILLFYFLFVSFCLTCMMNEMMQMQWHEKIFAFLFPLLSPFAFSLLPLLWNASANARQCSACLAK